MFKVPWLFLRKALCLPVSESIFPGLPLPKDSLTMSPSRIPRMGIYPLMGGGLEKEPWVVALQAEILLSLSVANITDPVNQVLKHENTAAHMPAVLLPSWESTASRGCSPTCLQTS